MKLMTRLLSMATLGLSTGIACASEPLSVERAMQDLAVNSEILTMAGLNETAIGALLARVNEASELREALAADAEVIDEAIEAIHIATQLVADQPGDSEAQAALANATSQLNDGQALQQIHQQELSEVIADGLSSQVEAVFANWRSSTTYRVPPAFRVVARTEEQWQQIEHALIAEQRTDRLDQTLDSQQAALLQTVRSESDVEAAQALLDMNLTATTALVNGLLEALAD